MNTDLKKRVSVKQVEFEASLNAKRRQTKAEAKGRFEKRKEALHRRFDALAKDAKKRQEKQSGK